MSPHPIQQSFNRAASSYEASARLQQQVADQLVEDIRLSLPASFNGHLLDAGCGTGYCLSQLHRIFPHATLLGIDFAETMLRQYTDVRHASHVNGNLEQLPLSDASIDLYVSSLAWQWCDISAALQEATRVLKPGAGLWLTTLVDGTFHELKSALSHAGLSPTAHLLTLPEESAVIDAFHLAHLKLVTTRCQPIQTWHSDFNALRHSIRGVGANHVPTQQHEPIDRAARKRLIDACEENRTRRGLALTYNVLTIHALRA